ncbi:separin [Brachionichthys hirsutus]|uniref:separin n=1 Tax=Brachionichthys hirsutus TaxID=412623 RepID=UPI0036049931
MKYLKVEEYIKRTASLKETELLRQQLESHVKNRADPPGRTLCDRIIRACNHQLGAGPPSAEHVGALVQLVERSLQAYDVSAAPVTQSSPLYMEKILFHIIKKLSSLEAHRLCGRVAGLLYSRLTPATQVEDFCVVVQSCFSVLWNGLSADKGRRNRNPHDKLHYQMQALRFLLLLDSEGASSSTFKAPIYTEDAVSEFGSRCDLTTKDDAAFLIQEMLALINTCWTGGGSKPPSETSVLHVLLEMLLITVKLLCKAGHHEPASAFMNDIEGVFRDRSSCLHAATLLGKWAVKVHATMKAGDEGGQALTECSRALRSLPSELGDRDSHSVVEGCKMVAWAVESGHSKGLSGAMLLAWFAFLEEHQEQMLRMLKKVSGEQAESSRLQQALCFSLYQGFLFAYESLLGSQLEDGDTLNRVLLYCQAALGLLMLELHKLPDENLLIKAVIAVSNLVCALYNRHLYDQAFALVEVLCIDLCKSCPVSLSVDRLSRSFMLAVQTSRRAGQPERALDWVILWLKALGDKITPHMAEPVSLWVKTKTDAARNSDDDDIRLRTLRDGFGRDVPDEQVMLFLLGEELHAYKEVAADTAQERYNTLCDLLEICHEESPHTHLRAIYLCEMAQVVCYQDFSEQTDCTAVDFTHEALRLLEEEPETPDNADRLKDDTAHALLWHYICKLEKNLQDAIEGDKKRRQLQEQNLCVTTPIGTNDFEYEDRQKTQDSNLLHEDLHFNLAAENELCKPLERALAGWSTLLQSPAVPCVRNPRQTCSSIAVMAALFQLMGKPLKALEAYQLVIGLSRQLADARRCASSRYQSASILLDLGAPELALAQLDEAERFRTPDSSAEEPSSLSVLAILLKARYCYSAGKVSLGVPYLCKVLKEVNEQRQSKAWYVLRAQTLRTCGSYLSLDTMALPQGQRALITQYGISSPDTALYESLKLFCSLLVTLVGRGLYGTTGSSADVRFIDQGDNLTLKWQLLSELLNCSMKMVHVRSGCGAVNDARLQCLEALKLGIKLQAPSLCAELLVMKAELELMQGEEEECGFDLDRVRSLLELCTEFSDQVQKAEVKIKPRKGRPLQKCQSPLPALEDDFKDVLNTRWIAKEPIERDLAGSPPLKAQPCRALSSLSHDLNCQCPCCSEPCLGRATARWAATQADLILQRDPNQATASLKLQWATLARCKSVSAKLGGELAKLFLPSSPTKPSLMQDLVARVYLCLARSGLDPRHNKVCGIWEVLEAGFEFVDRTPSPELRPVRAGLMATKAIVSLVTLAAKTSCTPEELCSHVWTWNPPKIDKELILERKAAPTSSSLSKPKKTIKKTDPSCKTKEAKKTKLVKPKIQVSGSSTKAKSPFPMTPAMVESKPSHPGAFAFNSLVPALACTPVQKGKPPSSVQKAPRTTPRPHFHVYEELSPAPDKAQLVPAAPRRTKKPRFKVEFSDESDAETNPQTESKQKPSATKKRSTSRRAASDPAGEEGPVDRRAKGKRSTASSADEDVLIHQPVSARKGRTRREPPTVKADSAEEPDNMRTIEEETIDVLDVSVELLRTSDAEDIDVDFEVLRRDLCRDLERDDLSELRSGAQQVEGLQARLSQSDTGPDDLSLADVQSLLRSAWASLKHLPCPASYTGLCALLVLTIGQQDPVTTAMLHAESLGITSRHRTVRHLASFLKKLRKTSAELVGQMDALSLEELGPSSSTERMLSQLENIVSFPTHDSAPFPNGDTQEFMQRIQHLPPGVTVCVMSVYGVKPGPMGDNVLLTRLARGSAPVTAHIPTSTQQHPISWLVQEMDRILVEQKRVSCVSEKAKWWEGRRALDSRVERLLAEMEDLLGCWKSLLQPLSLDPELSKQTRHLCKSLSAKGVTVDEEILKAVLSASPVLSQEELRRFALGLSPRWSSECDELLRAALAPLANRQEPNNHVVLILDKHLQKLPWESVSILSSRSVSRMPSLHALIGLSIQKEADSQSILNRGVDTKEAFYVLDPDCNLRSSQDRFKEWFRSKRDWDGVCGAAPGSGQLEDAVATKDLYVYVGHGAGARFLGSQAVLRRQMKAASLLFGCSSAALAVRGSQEGQGIILNYLIAGCPFVLGNLWDVTDRDIDRFTTALLESWLSAGSGAQLLDYMGPSRQATLLKHLIGAAPVVYGLPIHLQ